MYLRQWDSSSCSCKCRSSPLECAPGLHWDSANCRCHRYLRVFVFVFVFLRWISRSNQYICKLFAALSRDTKRQAAGWRGAAVCKLYWSSHGLEFTNRSRDENGSAQLYLLYLSLTAVGVVLLLAISLYCRYPPSMSFLVLEREIALCPFWTLPKFYC